MKFSLFYWIGLGSLTGVSVFAFGGPILAQPCSSAIADTPIISQLPQITPRPIPSPTLPGNLPATLTNPTGEEDPLEKKECTTTEAPGTNKKGENGTNRCTTCEYTSIDKTTTTCIFIKPKN